MSVRVRVLVLVQTHTGMSAADQACQPCADAGSHCCSPQTLLLSATQMCRCPWVSLLQCSASSCLLHGPAASLRPSCHDGSRLVLRSTLAHIVTNASHLMDATTVAPLDRDGQMHVRIAWLPSTQWWIHSVRTQRTQRCDALCAGVLIPIA